MSFAWVSVIKYKMVEILCSTGKAFDVGKKNIAPWQIQNTRVINPQ